MARMAAERGIEAIGNETNRLRADADGRPLNKTDFFPFPAVDQWSGGRGKWIALITTSSTPETLVRIEEGEGDVEFRPSELEVKHDIPSDPPADRFDARLPPSLARPSGSQNRSKSKSVRPRPSASGRINGIWRFSHEHGLGGGGGGGGDASTKFMLCPRSACPRVAHHGPSSKTHTLDLCPYFWKECSFFSRVDLPESVLSSQI